MRTFYTLAKRPAFCGYGMSLADNRGVAHAPMSARAFMFQPPGGSPMRNTVMLAMFFSVALLGGCVSRPWDGKVRMWGTLRGVLHDGDTAGSPAVGGDHAP